MRPNEQDESMRNSWLERVLGKFHGLRTTISKLVRQGMLRSIGILVGGTLIGHTVTMLAMLVSTRLFTPEDFSVLSVFASIVGICVVVACLRFDAAIILPEEDKDAINLLALSILLSALTCSILYLLLLILPREAFRTLGVPGLMPYLWLIPIGVFVGGLYLAAQAWLVRVRQFAKVAHSRALQATGAAAAQIGLGAAGVAPLGLLVGHVMNFGVGGFFLLTYVWRENQALLRDVSWQRIRTVARTYDKFPKYSTWEGLANGMANSGPLIIIAAMAPGPEAGYLALSLFVLQAPLALLGNAVGQVYVSEAASANREKRLGAFTADVLGGLVASGAGPLLCIAIMSPYCFDLVFGLGWERSGILVSWMVPWFFLQYLASPICNALHVTGHQKVMMNFHIIGMIVRVGGVVLAGFYLNDLISEIWAITGWIFYAGYLMTILVIVKLPAGSARAIMRKLIPSAGAGAAAGALAVLCLNWLRASF